jgi:hypothetical protein
MPVTKEQFNKLAKQAADDFARKIKLERPFGSKVDSFFKDLTSDFSEYYAKHGAAIGLNEYQKQLESILNDHHVTVASDFSKNIRNIFGNPNNNDSMQRKLNANIRGYAAQRSHLMSHSIIDTTRGNMEMAVKDAQVTSLLSEKELTQSQIAKIASNNLIEKLTNRAPNIATTETQAGAETGKSLEFSTMRETGSEIDGVPVKGMAQEKIWIAILDDHTRPDHVEADAQEVGVDEPFEVGDELMMFPGDDSLGATAGNLCNCRCSCQFIID